MALATAAAIAGIASAGVGIGKSLFGGNSQQEDQFKILAQQLALARQNAQQTGIDARNVNRTATAGFTDSSGSSLQYDPATNQWVSTLGRLPQQAQNAYDQATIDRNTTDMAMARSANQMALDNAARAQPLIDAARRRYENFRPMQASDLTSLLAQRAVESNNETFRPLIQDTLMATNRANTGSGQILADLGRASARQLRAGMLDAEIGGIQNVGTINNQNRQGLAGDLAAAQNAGTAQFQFPTIAQNNPNAAMLAAINDRARTAAFTGAGTLNAQTNAIKAAGDAASGAAGKVPDPLAGLQGVQQGLGSLSNLLKTDSTKTGLKSIGDFFSPPTDPEDTFFPANGPENDTFFPR